MLDKQQARSQRERASEPHAHPERSIEVADATLEQGLGDSDFKGQVGRLARDVRRWRLDLKAERNREILDDSHRLEKRRTLTDDPEPIEQRQPISAVDDVCSGATEDANLSGVWQACARDKVDQDLRRRLIESEQRNLFARFDDEMLNAERTQRTILLGDAVKFEDRFGHEWVTMRAGSHMMSRDF